MFTFPFVLRQSDHDIICPLVVMVMWFACLCLISHCMLFPIFYYDPLSIILPLSVICHFPLSVIPHYIPFLLYVIYHWHNPAYIIPHCLLFPIICHSPLFLILHCLSVIIHYLSFTIVHHLQLSVIPNCTSFTIVCHLSKPAIPFCMSYPILCQFLLSVIPCLIVCHNSVSVISQCLSVTICHTPVPIIPHCMSFTIVFFQSSLYIIIHYLSYPIVC